MKRMLILLFCISLVLAAGCKKKGNVGGKELIELYVFYGGFGKEYFERWIDKYEQARPDVTASMLADARIDIKIRPRIMQNTPPTITDSHVMPHWQLIQADRYASFTNALNEPAWGKTEGKWRDTFLPGVLDLYTVEGKTYSIPIDFGTWVIWYDKKLFREHGWEVPTYWDEMVDLCENIQDTTDIAPFGFQGLYPSYGFDTLMGVVQREAGLKKYYAIQNLEPEAFLDPDVVEAARKYQEISTKYFQPGVWGMSHTISQVQWVQRKSAMIACGLWLKTELADNIPDDFEMSCFPIPIIRGKEENGKATFGSGGHNFFVFKDGPNPDLGIDFIKFATDSENIKDYINAAGSLSTIGKANDEVTLPPELQTVREIMNNSDYFFGDYLPSIYPSWTSQTMTPLMLLYLRGEISPEEFCRRMDNSLQDLKNDPTIFNPPPFTY